MLETPQLFVSPGGAEITKNEAPHAIISGAYEDGERDAMAVPP